jgi:glycosyltransferase involved in cell wall biosynthesis
MAADGRVDLRVIFVEAGAAPRFDEGFGRTIQWQDDLLEGFDHVVLERETAVTAALAEFGPDVVYAHGYSAAYLQSTMAWGKSHGAAVLMMTDSELLHPRPAPVAAIKRLVMPFVLRNVDLFLTVGDENERYFRHYGIRPGRFQRVGFSIDSRYYDALLPRREELRAGLRERLGIAPDATVVLTVGKMIDRKRQSDLIKALAELKRDKAVLLIAGDGPDRAALEALAAPLGETVRMPGFVGVAELPEYYLASDIYAHPSLHDPHPLAISEALYCGLPVVASDMVGSIGPSDDVQVGRNGWSYPAGDAGALAQALKTLIDDPELRRRAGAESEKLGQLHASTYVAKRFVDAALLAASQNTR